MHLYKYPEKELWNEIVQRPVFDRENLRQTIAEVFRNVEQNGDEALRFYTKKFDLFFKIFNTIWILL